MEKVDYQQFTERIERKAYQTPSAEKTTNRTDRVGEDWPPLLSKKWLAARFGCLMANGQINRRRFRALVLTEEVLERAGIPVEFANSKNCKTFNAIHSMQLTTILRGFCLALLLSISCTVTAQYLTVADPSNPVTPPVTPPVHVPYTAVFDTMPGTMVVSDSIIRMVQVRPGEYKYQAVLSTIVFDGFMVKEFQAPTSGTLGNPKLMGHRFYHKEWGLVDPKRVLLFKTNQ
jgi:hypothetical protein